MDNKSYDKLYEILIQKKVMEDAAAESWCHALHDIKESIDKVYDDLIPQLLSKTESDKEPFLNLVWDIREEFRHIQYHIDDGHLTE